MLNLKFIYHSNVCESFP